MKHHLNLMKSLTEEHLKEFITCPYKFYYEYIEKKKRPMDWRQMVQHVVNQVVYTYYRLPDERRHSTNVLFLIEQYWTKVPLSLFESRIHYYMVAAKITDYLMQNLTAESDKTPPLFLFEKFRAHIQELDVDLSLTFDVAEWSSSSFVVKKYLVEAKEDMLKLYYYLTVVFSEKVFQKIPERIEVITLLDGKKHSFFPSAETIDEIASYLQVMKYFLDNTSGFNGIYNDQECWACAFQHICEHKERNVNPNKYLA